MQYQHVPYRPYLIHRVECHYAPENKGIMALCSYDDMGSAEFEFGAVSKALASTRQNLSYGTAMWIVRVPLITPIRVPVEAGGVVTYSERDAIYALMPDYALELYSFPAFADTVNQLVAEKLDTKEMCYFNRNFAMWHDLENGIYFSYSEVWLRLVYAMLARDRDFVEAVQQQLKFGDDITIAKALNGKAVHDVTRMEIVEGRIAGILENGVAVKRHSKTYRMPFEYIISPNYLGAVYEYKELP